MYRLSEERPTVKGQNISQRQSCLLKFEGDIKIVSARKITIRDWVDHEIRTVLQGNIVSNTNNVLFQNIEK